MSAKISLPLQNDIAAALNPWVSQNRPISDTDMKRAARSLHDRYQGELVHTKELRKRHLQEQISYLATNAIRAEQKGVKWVLMKEMQDYLRDRGYSWGSFYTERAGGAYGMPLEYRYGWRIPALHDPSVARTKA